MRDQKYLSVLFFDGMEGFHDLQAAFFVLRAEDLIKGQEPYATATTQLTKRLLVEDIVT